MTVLRQEKMQVNEYALTKRSQEKEIMDLGPAFYELNEYQQCLNHLFTINKCVGIVKTTINTLKKFAANASVLDIGCGNGLFILHLSKCFPDMQFTGLDIATDAINAAENKLSKWQKKIPTPKVIFKKQSQHQLAQPANSVDIILSTLVCHHLTDSELIQFLQNTLDIAKQAVIINDLERHVCSSLFFKTFSFVFRNRLIKHDGLISIRRGFKRREWQLLLNAAGIKHYEINWHFPFRWQIILWKK